MKLSDIKNTWKQYGDLIKTLAAVFTVIFSGIAFIASIVIKDMLEETIAAEVATLPAVTDLNTTVGVLVTTAENLDTSVKRLDGTVTILQGDVTDINRHLAGMRPLGMTP